MNRNSSIELLRLVLMVLIIIHHCIVHGLGLVNIASPESEDVLITASQMPIAITINALCICAVNCFVLISGYFGISNSKHRIITLLATILFYSLILATIPYFIMGKYKSAIASLFFVSHSPYWFIKDYLFLLVFAPILNLMFERLPEKTIKYIMCGLLIISCYFGFVWRHEVNPNGYTLMQFILMYCLGRYIATFKIQFTNRTAILTYLLGSLCCAFVAYGFWSVGKPELSWRMTHYNNPCIIISAIGLFMLFKNLTLSSKTINYWAKSALAIYLIQSAPLIGQKMYDTIKSLFISNSQTANWGGVWIEIIIMSIAVAVTALLIDKIRIWLFSILLPRIFKDRKKQTGGSTPHCNQQ